MDWDKLPFFIKAGLLLVTLGGFGLLLKGLEAWLLAYDRRQTEESEKFREALKEEWSERNRKN